MLYLALGILLLATVVTAAPIIGPYLTETVWFKKGLVVLAGFALGVAGVLLIGKSADVIVVKTEIGKAVYQLVIVATTVLLTLFVNWIVRAIVRAIYDKGFHEAESAYQATIDDLRTENAGIYQYLAEKGITLPDELYPTEDEGPAE